MTVLDRSEMHTPLGVDVVELIHDEHGWALRWTRTQHASGDTRTLTARRHDERIARREFDNTRARHTACNDANLQGALF